MTQNYPASTGTAVSIVSPTSGANHGLHVDAKHVPKHPHFSITPAKLWKAFLLRWKLALCVGFVFATVGAVIAWITYLPKYTAVATMRLNATKPRILPGMTAEDVGAFNRELDFQKIQSQLVKSRDVLGAVLKKDQISGLASIREQQSPQIWLEKELQAGFVTGTDIFRIWLSGANPEDITLIVNMVQQVYLEQFVNYDKRQQAERFSTIENVMSKAEEKIRADREGLRRLAEMHKTGDTQVLTLRQRMALEEFSAMKKELSGIDSDLRRTVALATVLRTDLKNLESEKIPAETMQEFVGAHPLVQKELGEISRLEIQIKEYSKVVTATSPRLRQLEDELKAARAQLQKVKIDVEPDASKTAREVLTRQKSLQLSQAEEKLKVHREQYNAVAEQAILLGKEADKIGIGTFDIELRRAQIEEAEVTLKRLRVEKERLDIEKYNTREVVENKQEAEIPTVNQASLIKSGSIWSLAGLVLGCFCVSFLEARMHRLHQSTEVHQELGLQTLGVLPLLEAKESLSYGTSLLKDQTLANIVFADAVNNMCMRLLCDDRLSKNTVIMVSSAGENDGKTMLASQLAIGMAHSGRKTLLLDCDFRKPECHEHLKLAAGPGLSELLTGEIDLQAALQTLPESEACLITSGKRDVKLIKALSNGKFAALLARLREHFDTIIIDSAPTLIVSDGFLIGKMVEGVLLVIRSTVSKGPAVHTAYEQLRSLKIPVLGVVVNGMRDSYRRSYYPRNERLESAVTPQDTLA